jgi:Mrp family chromosome partitioning ATPase
MEYEYRLDAGRARAGEIEADIKQARAFAHNPDGAPAPAAALPSSSIIDEYRRKTKAIKLDGRAASGKNGDNHADVRAAKAELAKLEKDLVRQLTLYAQKSESAHASAIEAVNSLEGQLGKLKDSLGKAREHELRFSALSREIAVTRDLYAKLLSSYKVTDTGEDTRGTGVRVLAYASPPVRPSYPKKTLVLILSGMAWLGLGLALGARRELNHRSLRSRADVEEGLGVPCIAMLPSVEPSKEGAEGQSGLAGPICWKIIDDGDQDGAFGQAVYALKHWIEKADGPASRVVLIDGVHPAAGRSTVAAQLALRAAEGGTRTVLVDGDLRSRALTGKLWRERNSNAKTGRRSAGDPKTDVVQVEGTPLWFCPAPVEGDGRVLDLLGSKSMKDFFGALRQEFELVIVDTSPMASYIDAAALAPYCDCIVLVIKASHTHQRDAIAVLDRLNPAPATRVGAVLNLTRSGQRE